MRGRFQAAATLASTLQLSSSPKKATTPCFHWSVSSLTAASVSPWVSPHIKFKVWFGRICGLALTCCKAYVIAPEMILPCRFLMNLSVLSTVRYPTVMLVFSHTDRRTTWDKEITTTIKSTIKQTLII